MIEIYTKGSCPYCVKAKKLLENKGIPYKEHIIGIHIMRESFLELFPDARTVPQIIETQADGFSEIIGGYSDLEKYLEPSDLKEEGSKDEPSLLQG